MTFATLALAGTILLLDRHLPALLRRAPSTRRWRLPSLLGPRTNP